MVSEACTYVHSWQGCRSLVKSLASAIELLLCYPHLFSMTFFKIPPLHLLPRGILGAPFPTSSRMGDKTLSKTSAEAITAGGIPVWGCQLIINVLWMVGLVAPNDFICIFITWYVHRSATLGCHSSSFTPVKISSKSLDSFLQHLSEV